MQKMPARSKQIIKHRRRDKVESKIIEIEEIEKEKTKAWGHGKEEQEDETRCWGPCPPPTPPAQEGNLEELEIT
jgi:hypothetical protein